MSDKDKHVEELKSDVTHVDGEGEGCVTRCKWKKEVASNGWTRMACEFTGHDHRKNGRNFHVANNLSWYNLDFSVEGPARARLERELKRGFIVLNARKPDPRNSRARQTWWMTRSGNFKSQSKPWSFNAHHLIPIGSLHSTFSIEKESGKSDLLLLQKAKYNVNAGVNIMFLPTQEPYAYVFELPAHLNAKGTNSNHRDYNDFVEKQLDSIKKVIAEAASQGEDHPALTEANVGGLKSELEDFSRSMREVLREVGVARSKANDLREPDNFLSHSLDIID